MKASCLPIVGGSELHLHGGFVGVQRPGCTRCMRSCNDPGYNINSMFQLAETVIGYALLTWQTHQRLTETPR
eukprot:scaffold39957_cov44-Prasinocladus_malaysianus.AAC.1